MGPFMWVFVCIITASIFEDSATAQCRSTPPCNLECHCNNTGQCSVTGCDAGGCLPGWDGPTCQRANAVLGFQNVKFPGPILGTSSRSSDLSWPSMVFDGSQTTYFRTNSEQNPYLWVNLGSLQTVNALSVVTKVSNFQIDITNDTTSRDKAIHCTSNNAQYSILVKRYDVTCDQPVYGCSDYWFGEQCDKPCNCKTRAEVCNKLTGHCTSGYQCPNWFDGPDCKGCSDYWFGEQCDKPCNCKTRAEVCNKLTGHCTSGYQCPNWFDGPDCKDCVDGYYGENCSHDCGHCLESSSCNKTDGECSNGCDPGFESDLCNIVAKNKCSEVPSLGYIMAVAVISLLWVLTSVIAVVFYMKSRRLTRLYQIQVKAKYANFQVNRGSDDSPPENPVYEEITK